MSYITREISGWGNFPKQTAQIYQPSSVKALKEELSKNYSFIPRGMGRSYGDSANSSRVISTSFFKDLISFDKTSGQIVVGSGARIRDILKIIINEGWFLPVSPGTSFVTLGGAIASDVHGKNHHKEGTFGMHVISMKILLGNGNIVNTSPNILPELFYATCGGMGLTGLILEATIQLIPIDSAFIDQKIIKTDSLEETCEAFEKYNHTNYSVAWLDCISNRSAKYRGLVMLGEHAIDNDLNINIKKSFSVPKNFPSSLLNKRTLGIFNSIYYFKSKNLETNKTQLFKYFYALDSIDHWNRFYGKSGLLQYQFVVPEENGVINLKKILNEINSSQATVILAVLKKFGPANKNLLSFPMHGFTLALDFKMSQLTINLLLKLDKIISDMGGRVYLTKDAVMHESTFKSSYPRWKEFEEVRERFGAIGKFSSAQSRRLGLA